jgi:hypothetical protein
VDAPADAAADAPLDAHIYCDLGLAHGDSVGGTIRLFDAEGNPLPAGHYRISYTNGCMIYGSGQPFTVHAYQPSIDAAAYATWTLVNAEAGFVSVRLPGYWIYGPDAAAPPADYNACVALNLTAPPVEFDYGGGVPLGVVVNDSPLSDNIAGPDGGDPTWRLELYLPDAACP